MKETAGPLKNGVAHVIAWQTKRRKGLLWILQAVFVISNATAFAPSFRQRSLKENLCKAAPDHRPRNDVGRSLRNPLRIGLLAMFGSRNKNNIEVGIQTAQLLMDRRRHDNLKRKMQQQFPIIPDVVLDSSIDIVANTFTQVAPDKLKVALEPGGMDQVRPEIEQIIVRIAMEQPVIQSIPVLNQNDKIRLVQAIVSKALDYILQDAQEVLAAPEVRLETLEEQLTEIKALMGPRRLFLYRVRHNYKRIIIATAISVASIAIYQHREAPAIVRVLELPKIVRGLLSGFSTWVVAKYSVLSYEFRTTVARLSAALRKIVAPK